MEHDVKEILMVSTPVCSEFTASKRTENRPTRWAVILAGGDGSRLLPLTRTITGDDRPKQFCALAGEETMLEQTRRRVSYIVPEPNTLIVVTRTHEPYYQDALRDLPSSNLLVQPCNHGTAPAIAYSLARLNAMAPDGLVAFFPSDHHFGDSEAFAASVGQAFAHAQGGSERVLLLGITPESPEESYGWIEPGACLRRGRSGDLFEVRRFWEKPSRETAAMLMSAGCLWNSFIMVGRVSAFLKILRSALPALIAAFEESLITRASLDECEIDNIYASVEAGSFSHEVLSTCPRDLAVLPAKRLGWTDLGEPKRVFAALQGSL